MEEEITGQDRSKSCITASVAVGTAPSFMAVP